MADDKNKCKNPSCTCPAQPGGKYCSASCEGAGNTIELALTVGGVPRKVTLVGMNGSASPAIKPEDVGDPNVTCARSIRR